mmetsp:Transcript_15869/g.31885  ORF Transcript_15869/g.31885 Transcript_15869/m.31885 type:complete len:246 (+) Transcript_15869:339-1076(+)
MILSKADSSILGRPRRTLLQDRHLDTLPLWQRDERLVALTDHEHVAQPSGEGVAHRVLKVDNVEAALMALTRDDDADAPSVLAAVDHRQITRLELDEIFNLPALKIQLDHVIDADQRIWVAHSAAIMRHNIRHLLGAHLESLHSAQLVLALLRADTVDSEAAADVVEKAEEFVRLLDANDIHEARRVSLIGPRLAVNLDEALHEDVLHLLGVEGILETIAQKNDQRQALTQLVGASGRPRRPDAA